MQKYLPCSTYFGIRVFSTSNLVPLIFQKLTNRKFPSPLLDSNYSVDARVIEDNLPLPPTLPVVWHLTSRRCKTIIYDLRQSCLHKRFKYLLHKTRNFKRIGTFGPKRIDRHCCSKLRSKSKSSHKFRPKREKVGGKQIIRKAHGYFRRICSETGTLLGAQSLASVVCCQLLSNIYSSPPFTSFVPPPPPSPQMKYFAITVTNYKCLDILIEIFSKNM